MANKDGGKQGGLKKTALIGIFIVIAILIVGTLWTGRSAREDAEKAAHSVSLLYLDELANRREQVVAANLQNSINTINVATGMLDDNDLQDMEHLQAFQRKMKALFNLEKFAFVDSNGLIYTSTGTQTDIDKYRFDYRALEGPEISIKNMESKDKKVIIAAPLKKIPFIGRTLVACFMEIDMKRMLEGVSLQSDDNHATFCNLYTRDGRALTDMVLGGLASEDNLLVAMEKAEVASGHSRQAMYDEFTKGQEGVISFTYGGIQETLYFVPVKGTDWMLTYLVRESLISKQINAISEGIIKRNLVQTVLTALVLLGLFGFMLQQVRRSARLTLEKETAEAENRVKQQELEQRLTLQGKLLEEEKQRKQQDKMITALASDYRSVYYVDLDLDEGICYRSGLQEPGAPKDGERFSFHDAFTDYANKYVTESFREGFLDFISPESIRKGLEKNLVISYRYLVNRDGQESYEMLRMAGVRHAEDPADHFVHAVGVGFADVDEETRESMAKNQALSDALTVAEEANRAKTAFLSNMSHEIRTPMNAIIGLDNIALNEKGISDTTKEYLEKIGGSARHLLTLINDILDMSRIESGRMTLKNEEFSISRLLEQINTLVSGQCNDKGIDYRCDVVGHVDDYYIGDDMKLRQIILNLLSNAVKFTPEGGAVKFTVERAANFDNKSTLRFTVKDTGIGMNKEFLPKLFEAFSQEDSSSTNKYGSSGLGMAITKNMVDMMNGKIEVDSEKGKGTTFTVTVTLMDSRRKDALDEPDIDPQDMSVLVVDDDPIACEHARLVMEKIGIAAETALSGAEAVEKVRFHHARRTPYNLILVDWKMPEMDGLETTRQIRAIVGNESAIIILTAYRWDEVVNDAVKAGVDSFLAKPLFASNVMEEFRQAVKKKNIESIQKKRKAELKGRRILLAEDVAINAEIVMMLLSMKEVETDHALNGKIAVEKFAEHPENYYDAILMDIRMPEMDGLTAAAKIRAMDRADARTIPIAALTANAFDEDVQRSLQAGMNVHLSKPTDPEQLYSALESLIWEKENKEK